MTNRRSLVCPTHSVAIAGGIIGAKLAPMKTWALVLAAASWTCLGCSGSVDDTSNSCSPIPCPAPGWDPETCACRPPPDAGDSDSAADACTPLPCPAPGWDPETCACRPPDSVDAQQCLLDSTNLVYAFKTCHGADECVVAAHQVNCCGTMQYVGVAKSEEAGFASCEQAWVESLPGCGCASSPTTAEDGQDAADPSQVIVECTNFTMSGGICMTRVP